MLSVFVVSNLDAKNVAWEGFETCVLSVIIHNALFPLRNISLNYLVKLSR